MDNFEVLWETCGYNIYLVKFVIVTVASIVESPFMCM